MGDHELSLIRLGTGCRTHGDSVAILPVKRYGKGAMRTQAIAIASVLLTAAFATAVSAEGPKTHRLEATPSTIAYGYYWSEAKPALRIASGDVIDVDTLLTNNPTGLQKAGVPAAEEHLPFKEAWIIKSAPSQSAPP